jgi:tetratricopeptide (TPR) repeat protein
MLQPGTQVGRYEIQRRLGRGGMGTVYVAHDPVLGRMVAIKVFLSDLELADAAERFSREARSAAALNHPNIVTVHDFGDVASQPYIVMEYVQGETLAEIIRRKAPVAALDKVRWIEELGAGVSYAHQAGVVHRDIKPTNLMIDRSGRLKILDFGIAKMLGTLATNATALIGTPGYMAPEQILGNPIDHRSDLFSVGVVCYELLSYAEAFPGETVPTITHRILNEEPVPLGQLVPDINPALVALVERALRKNADERFPDAESLRSAVGRLRRQLETEPGWEITSISPRGVTPIDAGGRRGTGSARERLGDVVSVAELTPPPDPRRTDREALARRRATQIEAALELSRAFLDRRELPAALDACEQALTLDDTHAVALELEMVIRGAMATEQATALLSEARTELERGALTAAQDYLQQARALNPDMADARRIERDLRLARVEQQRLRQRGEAVGRTIASAREALERGEIEAALACAREALALDPESDDAQAIETEAMRRLDEDTGADGRLEPAGLVPSGQDAVEQTMLAPPRRTPAPAPIIRTAASPTASPSPATDRLEVLRAWADSVRSAIVAMPRSRKQITAAVAGTFVLVIAGALAFALRSAPVVPTGTLVIDAVPWATVVAIESVDGTAQQLPTPASTPLAVALPEGTYTVRIAGPPPDAAARVLTITVQAGSVASTPMERFRSVTPEEYFEPYLASPRVSLDAPADAAAAPATGANPAAASVKPAGTIQ